MSNSLTPTGGDDRVYTPPELAAAIVKHFNPTKKRLEPCSGKGVFVDAMYEHSPEVFVEECEIDKGVDFLLTEITEHYDWVVTNPPWSQLRAFLKKSMEVADNVVFLCCTNAMFYRGRYADIQKAGFGFKEIAMIKDIPKKPWPQSGFCLSAVHLQKGWAGATVFSEIKTDTNTEDWM